MKLTGLLFFITGLALMAAGVALGADPPNPRIDFETFRKPTTGVAEVRETRRLSGDDFIRMAKEIPLQEYR